MKAENHTTFQKLLSFSRVMVPENIPFESLNFIETKLQSASILAHDLPRLADAHFAQEFKSREGNPEVVKYNPIFQIRIASSCESMCSSVYGAGEISAKCIGSKLRPQKVSDFRKLKKVIKNGELDNIGLSPSFFDFEGHEKILAIRSETSHYSSVFVAMPDQSRKTLCFKTLSQDMKKVGDSHILLEDVVSSALISIDNITKLLCIFFDNVIFPKLDLDRTIRGNVERDIYGMPIVRNGLVSPLPDLTIRDHLLESGLGHLLD